MMASTSASASASASHLTSPSKGSNSRKPFLPVLILPGFMSSGLEVRKSSLQPRWEGQRLWLNLTSLGIHAASLGGTKSKSKLNNKSSSSQQSQQNDDDDDDDDDDDGANKVDSDDSDPMTFLWLQHIALSKDMKTEYPGIQVRNMEGLEGVDYLTPGALTNFVSYVFGPIIRVLLQAGYNKNDEGIKLDAAPYDWRLSPQTMHDRDDYWVRTIQQIERMVQTNRDRRPVVLLCHSLGCKVGHYLLNFAKRTKGQAWINAHIHTYMPVGAPHLGAPKALRSIITGDKMGLEAFLSQQDALIFGRSLGSGPWLLPRNLPLGATTSALVKREGVLIVKFVGDVDIFPLIRGRRVDERPKKIRLVVRFGDKVATSGLVNVSDSFRVRFEEKFLFATLPNKPETTHGSSKLLLMLCEPGIEAARRKKMMKILQRSKNGNSDNKKSNCCLSCLKCCACCCILEPIIRQLSKLLCSTALTTVDMVAKISGGYTPIGKTDAHHLVETQGTFDMVMRFFSKQNTSLYTDGQVQLTWEPWKDTLDGDENNYPNCSPISEKYPDSMSLHAFPPTNFRKKYQSTFVEVSGRDLLRHDGLLQLDHSSTIMQLYDDDPFDPRGKSSIDAPPISRIQAIYGINLPTEVGAIYRRRKKCVERPLETTRYRTLDTKAQLDGAGGYRVQNGIILETKDTLYRIASANGLETVCRSGDGTVPYWSLQHVRCWNSPDCEVTVHELEGALHREILADERFHKLVLDYVLR
jgi:hypothetical protein